MSDDTQFHDATTEPETTESTESSVEAPRQPGVAVAENALVGDDNVAPVVEVEPDVHTDSVPAQTTGADPVPVDEVYVHETYVVTDQVITDPNSPEAVQIPDAGRGFLDLPIHQLGKGTVEDVFAKADAEADNDS